MDLICVPHDKVELVWPKVSRLIYEAMKRGDLNAFEPIVGNLVAGRSLLWIAAENTKICAAAVTEITTSEWRKVCTIVACGGKDMGQWIHLLGEIEQWAATENCVAMRLIGRYGWSRVLEGYRLKRVVLEKELA